MASLSSQRFSLSLLQPPWRGGHSAKSLLLSHFLWLICFSFFLFLIFSQSSIYLGAFLSRSSLVAFVCMLSQFRFSYVTLVYKFSFENDHRSYSVKGSPSQASNLRLLNLFSPYGDGEDAKPRPAPQNGRAIATERDLGVCSYGQCKI